ncbi:hypothetical protein AVEN_30332-1 [Araneus ventricosus]|uniref:Uncharacterized protein n=1 Tax=Araneus ventricosus TaxID=182803 RepID=A0A4Y2MIF4_ARAVE|nr:hypothetical protein AVEN_30332-1 [Araneus ventricosus]
MWREPGTLPTLDVPRNRHHYGGGGFNGLDRHHVGWLEHLSMSLERGTVAEVPYWTRFQQISFQIHGHLD